MVYKDYYVYDESSPSCLRWNKDVYSGRWKNFKNVSVGDVAGGVGSGGYYQVRVDGKLTLVHRVIWEMHYGEIPRDKFIDHIDGNKLNNRLSNLRIVARELNARNCKLREDSSSGVAGVNLCINTLKSGKIVRYWKACWTDLNTRKVKCKSFNIEKLGDEVAFEMAVSHREAMVRALNSVGAGYTERHGVGNIT